MRVVEFIERYGAPLVLGATAFALALLDWPIAAVLMAFTAGTTYREHP